MMKQAICRKSTLSIVGTILVSFAFGIPATPFSFDQVLTGSSTCTVEGVNPIVIPVSFGQRNGCSDTVRGTETIAVIDLRLLDEMRLLFAVGNFPCIAPQFLTFRNGESDIVCSDSSDATISPRDVLATYNFSFGDVVGLEFDINVSGLVSGKTLFTINGIKIQSSGVLDVNARDFSIEIFVPKDAPGQVTGDIMIRTAPLDSDNDGVPNNEDECPNSDLSTTVTIDGCNSGVTNSLSVLGKTGCTISDLIGQCTIGAKNHGKFVSCISNLTNALKTAGIITGTQKGAIQSCAGRANIP